MKTSFFFSSSLLRLSRRSLLILLQWTALTYRLAYARTVGETWPTKTRYYNVCAFLLKRGNEPLSKDYH